MERARLIELEKAGERSSALLLSTGELWIEFLPAESVGTCCVVCAGLRKIAEKDRVWKNFCRARWRRVNVEIVPDSRGGGVGSHRTTYASLNGWRDPSNRLRRTILSTAPGDIVTAQRMTRASQAAAPGGGHAKNISGMDVAPSRVVVCSADYAWYYEVPEQNSSITTSQRRNRHQDQQGTQQEHIQWVQLSAERCPRGYDGGSSQGSSGEDKNDAGEEATTAAKAPPPGSVRGFRLPSPFVTEARFSGDGERCFFGTISGQIYVHDCGDGAGGSGSRTSEAIAHWTPTVALESPVGLPVAVRQVVASFEGGCTKGSRLGVLCRPPSGWHANLEGSSEGGYLFLADSDAQAVVRRMNLGGGRLGGLDFPTMERGGAAVSTAPLDSSGGSFGSSGGPSGELFAVGFGGGTVALFDARCQEGGGMVGGFLTRHRWLERVRSAGSLLMASYGRNKNIETWDIRKLPPPHPTRDQIAPSTTQAHRPPPRLDDLGCWANSPDFGGGSHGLPPTYPTRAQRARPIVQAHQPPRRLDDLGCPANSPDFWVEPHGLCVAVHGAPRHSQRFGAKHVFWPWPKAGAGTWSCSFASPPARSGSESGARGGESAATCEDLRALSVGGKDAQRRSGGGRAVLAGFELPVPGVVSDSDYRLCLSTGIKFTDTHMATVLDSSRVLVDEMMLVAASPRGARGVGGRAGAGVATPVLLAA